MPGRESSTSKWSFEYFKDISITEMGPLPLKQWKQEPLDGLRVPRLSCSTPAANRTVQPSSSHGPRGQALILGAVKGTGARLLQPVFIEGSKSGAQQRGICSLEVKFGPQAVRLSAA